MIRKVYGKHKWKVLSEKGTRSFGTYSSVTAAKKRLKQVEFFKRVKK